jgi:predicted amidophosphoribosyltransferase
VLDLLLPQRCVVCLERGTSLCERCVELLPRITPPLCERCGAPASWPVQRCRDCAGRRLAFARARSAVVYDGAVRSLVSAWKERGLRRLAETAAELALEAVPPPTAGVTTFIPADPDRRLRRGHEPPRRLAELLAPEWGLPVEPLLRRARAAKRQRGLSRIERRRNVRGAFVSRTAVPATVVLVDDVYTSGATANAAASALRRGGARRVEVVTFARVVG